jgi:nitroreductase
MDALDAIRNVRVVRRYDRKPIPADTIATIVDAGRHAGSSKNQQRWEFIVVTDRDTLAALGDVGRYADHVPGAAAVVALVMPAAANPLQQLSIAWDIGRAAQNIVLAAWALGVGSCPVTVYDDDLAQRLLGYPDDRRCRYLLALGFPADPADLQRRPRSGGRKSYADVVHEGSW